MAKRRAPVSLSTVCKIGTIAHNRPFTARDFREYTGSSNLASLVKRGIVKKTGRNAYYPTSRGWDVIERACKMKR